MSIRKKILSNEFTVPDYLSVSHFPSLDGIRAISVFIVLLAHGNAEFNVGIINALLAGGVLGVYIFFVISGFLITTLLLKEKVKTGTISLRNFYIRRGLRILPVAYLYLIALFILHVFMGLKVAPIEYVGCLLFLVNLGYFHTGVYTGHFWSLSVEEQFYIVFPSILKRNYRVYINFLLILLVLILVVKSVDVSKLHASHHLITGFSIFKELIYRLDGIIIGSLLAISMFKGIFPMNFVYRYKILLHITLIPIILILFNDLLFYSPFNSVISAVLIAILLASNLKTSGDYLFKFLNLRILKRIGILSYSTYIWQQLILFRFNNVFNNSQYKYWGLVVCLFILSAVVYSSYEFFEKRFLSLKERFTKIKSSSN
ncbi:acyltransferase family protein [Mucilaginibacter sp. AW1-3]